MSVRECSECKGAISGSRNECPHCGKMSPPKPGKKRITVREFMQCLCYAGLAFSVGFLLSRVLEATVEGYLLGVAFGSITAFFVHPWG